MLVTSIWRLSAAQQVAAVKKTTEAPSLIHVLPFSIVRLDDSLKIFF
jgi:hypothetical protein